MKINCETIHILELKIDVIFIVTASIILNRLPGTESGDLGIHRKPYAMAGKSSEALHFAFIQIC